MRIIDSNPLITCNYAVKTQFKYELQNIDQLIGTRLLIKLSEAY